MAPDPPTSSTLALTDSELIGRVISGNPVAAEEFVKRFKGLIYSVVGRFAGLQEADVDDAFQNVLIKLFEDDCRRLRLFRGESKLSTYLVSVSIRLTLDYKESYIDRHQRRLANGEGYDPNGFRDPAGRSPEGETVLRKMTRVIQDALDSMEEACRIIIDMRILRDRDTTEIAGAMGITPNNFYQKLHRCMKILRGLLKSQYPDIFDGPLELDPSP